MYVKRKKVKKGEVCRRNLKTKKMKKMKKIILVITLLIGSYTVHAQNKEDLVKYTVDMAATEYKQLLRFNMSFTEKETKEFWKLMDTYLLAQDELVSKHIKLTQTQLSSKKFTDEEAEKYMKEMFKLEKKMETTKLSHFNKIRKVLPARKFYRFLQIDDYIETVRHLTIISDLPLIKN